ncbi:DNA repair protein RecN [Peptostreptococcus sp. D1]|uniref:DNA repair protein RecN n=1 Tax=Peptostreptococcus sp. D1 TaxID=72304 RepID=UPI0008EEACB6|nr:DNA repair protein RecN [Peptostreptococcus sp. D1]SFE74103.1 DNA repair protein RecN (Recombination protein N) [Peptostreptococcus sp. D1]
MIYDLYMKNCALVEELRVDFGKKLNILTGETGSGKSIILEALNLCIGGKFDRTYIRKGCDFAEVEALFFSKNAKFTDMLDKLDVQREEDGSVIVSRKLFLDGKSTTKINGKNIRVGDLKKLMSLIVDMHGQHQNQALYNRDNHIEFVDLFGKAEISGVYDKYIKVFKEYNEIKREILKINDNKSEKEVQREKDLLKFQIDEIEKARLDKNEYDELLKRRDIFVNSEKIYKALNEVYSNLNSSDFNALELIGRSVSLLSGVSKYDDKILEINEAIESIMYELEDKSTSVRHYIDSIEFEPHELDEIQERIDVYNTMKRKYGDSIDEILSYLEKMSRRLNDIENRDEILSSLQEKLSKKFIELKKSGAELTNTRIKASAELEIRLLEELNSLNMKNTRFKVNFNSLDYNENGCDDIEFFVSFNLGEDLNPLSKVASGGEMSRFMLAFKSILSDVDKIEALIFDEIDSGISGRAAQIVGEKLSNISKKKQVICITHLPQIASFADDHFQIEKNVENDRTYTRLSKLGDGEKKNEIARLISGKVISKKTIEHADEIIESAKRIKNN